ncbi:MAG: 16S rRNA (cytosine(967)-C(5))-methyltransferase RsmB [bacterium]
MTSGELALTILWRIETRKSYANILIVSKLNNHTLSRSDRNLVTLLVNGVQRNRNLLDFIISRWSKISLRKMSPWIRNLLRQGVYQLVLIKKVRDDIVVNESVKLAHKYGHRGSVSFVNAILRQVARSLNKEDPLKQLPSLQDDALYHLTVAYSHPEWIIRRWLARYGTEATASICEYNNQIPSLVIRYNKVKDSGSCKDEILHEQLEGAIPSPFVKDAFTVKGPRPMYAQDVYKNGFIDVLGLSSMIMVNLLQVKQGQNVLDACAGRGGKTNYICALMENKGLVIATDIYLQKLVQLKKNALRLGSNIQSVICCDLCTTLPFGSIFDRILVDAPCSSLGVLNHHPEIRWLRKEEDIVALSKIQKSILSRAGEKLRQGGGLLYCTCTLEPEETDHVILDFMEKHPTWRIKDLKETVSPLLKDAVSDDGMLRLIPGIWATDGFFACYIQR